MTITRRKFASLLVVVGMLASYFLLCTAPDLKANEKFVRIFMIGFIGIFLLTYLNYHANRVLRISVLSVLGMFSFSFALVPMYNVFCDVTGINGKVDLTTITGNSKGIDTSRLVTVEFDVNHSLGMPWKFHPQHLQLKVHPGQVTSTSYYAKNPTGRTMVAQAIPSVSPGLAAQHFKKVECFCFNQQILSAGEEDHMRLRFYLDPDLPADVKRITLSYTLFDVTEGNPLPGGHHHGNHA